MESTNSANQNRSTIPGISFQSSATRSAMVSSPGSRGVTAANRMARYPAALAPTMSVCSRSPTWAMRCGSTASRAAVRLKTSGWGFEQPASSEKSSDSNAGRIPESARTFVRTRPGENPVSEIMASRYLEESAASAAYAPGTSIGGRCRMPSSYAVEIWSIVGGARLAPSVSSIRTTRSFVGRVMC